MLVGDIYIGELTELGKLTKNESSWQYENTGKSMTFNPTGRLTRIKNNAGADISITYSPESITVSNQSDILFTFSEDEYFQPTLLNRKAASLQYTYDTLGRLPKLQKLSQNSTYTTSYLYADSAHATALTAILDNRGLVSKRWEYDSQGRAISAESADAIGKVTISYDDSFSTTSNELGKQTKYEFKTIQGVSRIERIEGEASVDCSLSNSSFTYNNRGQVLTKTDSQGYVTTYTYNDRGLETSRTEASGTPIARTTNIEWDPVRFLPITVSTPTLTTLYTYDNQGRQLSQQTTRTQTN